MSAIWHPFTQHALSSAAVEIARADGVYLYTKDGRKILDAISSWWVNTHGHCHPHIVEAVRNQAEKLEQVIFAGFTHEPAESLAEKLMGVTGGNFQYVFFSDSGSTAVEVALKMAIGYWAHTGMPRRKIVALEGAYHGDTFGGMAAGGRGVFSAIYEPYLFEVTHVPFPSSPPSPGRVERGHPLPEGEGDLSALEKILKNGDVAALIVEPLVLAAGGMKFYSAETLKKLSELCRAYDVLLIADEVMTGFGRTGTMFACQQAGIWPDIMCLSKGLTGGFLPMGATLCAGKIYDAFYQKDRSKMFFHSSSYTGNALACAAAIASLEIWEREPVLTRVQAISAQQSQAVARFAAREDVENARSLGTVLAMEVVEDPSPLIPLPEGRGKEAGYLADVAPKLYDLFMQQNVLLRPLGNTVYILPPYCITEEELNHVYDVITIALGRLRDAREQQAA